MIVAALLAVRAPGFLPESLAGFLFENHYPWWIALLVLGAVLIFVARARGNRKLLRGGQIVLAATLLWVVGARLVETAGERLYAAHVGLAGAAQKRDVDLILTYFSPQFSIDAININPTTPDAKKEIKSRLDQIGIKETTFRVYAATLNGDGTAVSRFTALTFSDVQPFLTTWEVSWEDVPGRDWKIRNAALRKIGEQVIKAGEIVP